MKILFDNINILIFIVVYFVFLSFSLIMIQSFKNKNKVPKVIINNNLLLLLLFIIGIDLMLVIYFFKCSNYVNGEEDISITTETTNVVKFSLLNIPYDKFFTFPVLTILESFLCTILILCAHFSIFMYIIVLYVLKIKTSREEVMLCYLLILLSTFSIISKNVFFQIICLEGLSVCSIGILYILAITNINKAKLNIRSVFLYSCIALISFSLFCVGISFFYRAFGILDFFEICSCKIFIDKQVNQNEDFNSFVNESIGFFFNFIKNILNIFLKFEFTLLYDYFSLNLKDFLFNFFFNFVLNGVLILQEIFDILFFLYDTFYYLFSKINNFFFIFYNKMYDLFYNIFVERRYWYLILFFLYYILMWLCCFFFLLFFIFFFVRFLFSFSLKCISSIFFILKTILESFLTLLLLKLNLLINVILAFYYNLHIFYKDLYIEVITLLKNIENMFLIFLDLSNKLNINILFIFGSIILLFAIFLKIGIFPFSKWVSVVYENLGIKGLFFISNVLAVNLLLIFVKFSFLFPIFLLKFFTIILFVSIIINSFLSSIQKKISKFLGYSGIINASLFLLMLFCNNIVLHDIVLDENFKNIVSIQIIFLTVLASLFFLYGLIICISFLFFGLFLIKYRNYKIENNNNNFFEQNLYEPLVEQYIPLGFSNFFKIILLFEFFIYIGFPPSWLFFAKFFSILSTSLLFNFSFLFLLFLSIIFNTVFIIRLCLFLYNNKVEKDTFLYVLLDNTKNRMFALSFLFLLIVSLIFIILLLFYFLI